MPVQFFILYIILSGMWIGHLDMDAFFARCEKLRNSELNDKPVVVCVYTRKGGSGAVSTADYRARELGIKSGMPLQEAKRRASDETVFLPVDHRYYRDKSESVISILRSLTGEIHRTSIDEAYFRIDTGPEQKARKIDARIRSLGLSGSIGIAPNKFLAKMASEEDKPSGLTIVPENQRKEFMAPKTVDKIHGVGEKTTGKLHLIGISTCSDLREADSSLLVSEFGREKTAILKSRARGEGSKEFEKSDRKQISRIRTMPHNSSSYGFVRRQLRIACSELWESVSEHGKAYRSVTVIGIGSDMKTRTRSTGVDTSDNARKMVETADELLKDLMDDLDVDLRRVGVRISDLLDTEKQASLENFRTR